MEERAPSLSPLDKRHQSVVFNKSLPSAEGRRTSFKLQEILKKRFKNFTRVRKYKALEKKIVRSFTLSKPQAVYPHR